MAKTTLIKYFNTWKYKKLPKEDIEEIIRNKKKTVIKKRVINLHRKTREEPEKPKEEKPVEEGKKPKDEEITVPKIGVVGKDKPEEPIEEDRKPKTQETPKDKKPKKTSDSKKIMGFIEDDTCKK